MDRQAGGRVVVRPEDEAPQRTAIVGSHHALARGRREEQQERLADRRVALDHLDPARRRHLQPCRRDVPLRRGVLLEDHVRVDEAPRAVPSLVDHAAPDTRPWPATRTLYWTTPGGVPSVRPITVSRAMACP